MAKIHGAIVAATIAATVAATIALIGCSSAASCITDIMNINMYDLYCSDWLKFVYSLLNE